MFGKSSGDAGLTLEDMKNLGPTSARRLRAIGIRTPADLRRLGAIEAYVQLRNAFPAETTPVALYSLHGALLDVRWYELSDEVTAALRSAAARRA
jgi:DNA transformation protein